MRCAPLESRILIPKAASHIPKSTQLDGSTTGYGARVAHLPGFILTKLLSNTIGVLVFMVALPGLILLVEIFLATHKLVPLLPLLAGTGVVLLALYFYLSLVIMLGVLFESRGPVLRIALGVMFAGTILRNFIPPINYVFPSSMEGIALMVEQGAPLPAMFVSQLISTAVLSIVFTLVALWRFQDIEL